MAPAGPQRRRRLGVGVGDDDGGDQPVAACMPHLIEIGEPDDLGRIRPGASTTPLTAAQFAAQVKADAAKWERIVRASGATVD